MAKHKVIYTPFDGAKMSFDSIREACRNLGVEQYKVQSKFKRQEKLKKPQVYLFEGGKIERA